MSEIDIVKSGKRHFLNFGWLQTYWLLSFSNYYDPHNIQFGALRVFNNDILQPGKGFPSHSHEEMEIITIVLDGEMTRSEFILTDVPSCKGYGYSTETLRGQSKGLRGPTP